MVKKLFIISFLGLIIFSASFLTVAYAVDNNCKITIVHLVEMPIALGCIEDRLDALENKPVQSGSENTSASNLGNGQGVFAQEVGDNLQFKSLGAGNGVSLQSNSTVILINSTSISDNTVCANVGSGSQIYKDGECNFRTVLGSPDISVSQQTDTITIDFNGTISASSPQIAQSTFEMFESITKTNIGNAYIDIYNVAFTHEELNRIYGANVTYFRISYAVDYVGTGTQQYRFVDANNNSNVLFEMATITADCNECTSGWFIKPSWVGTSEFVIEMQGKSTVAGDDPIVKGYIVMVK